MVRLVFRPSISSSLIPQNLRVQLAKYEANHFGTCPRVYCSQNKLVPCGRSDLPGVDTVKLFCSSCLDMYVPPSSRFQGVDGELLSLHSSPLLITADRGCRVGAFFGTTFPHLLFQTFPPPSSLPTPSPDPHTIENGGERQHTTPITSLNKVYVPRIYGFKVSERARSGPRMQWMRMRVSSPLYFPSFAHAESSLSRLIFELDSASNRRRIRLGRKRSSTQFTWSWFRSRRIRRERRFVRRRFG